jgi:hypothetical protein
MNLGMFKLEPLLGTVVNELGAASNAALVIARQAWALPHTGGWPDDPGRAGEEEDGHALA